MQHVHSYAKSQQPLDSLETIHVTGTNGKGSVTWKIARALQFGLSSLEITKNYTLEFFVLSFVVAAR